MIRELDHILTERLSYYRGGFRNIEVFNHENSINWIIDSQNRVSNLKLIYYDSIKSNLDIPFSKELVNFNETKKNFQELEDLKKNFKMYHPLVYFLFVYLSIFK